MSNNLFRIVCRGELAYGFEVEETRANLKRLCKYNDATLDKLLSGQKITIKSKLDLETAQRYKAALDKTGIVTTVEEILPSKPVSPKEQETIECPKCSQRQPQSLTCMNCGIVFAKYAQAQERKEAIARGEHPTDESSSGSTLPADASRMDRLSHYFSKHQEQAFILKAFLVIAGIIFVTNYLSGLLALFILLFPIMFLFYVKLEAASTGQSATAVLAQHITFMPVMYTEGERKKEGVAWVTYSLIAINILVFYGYELQVNPQIILNNLVFIPVEPNIVNVPISLFTSIFLHADGGHLWGNMLFLWALGVVVEKRIGWNKFLLFYLLAGVSASILSAVVHFMAFREPVHGLGASGAIAGVMGLFAIRCYFKSMVFPLPILGIFSLILPISLKVRLNSLVIIGLFFLADLHGGIGQVAGQSSSNVGHWAHLGGMMCGIILGMMFNLGEEAVEERHMEIGGQALSNGGDLYKGEESLRLALKKNPKNAEAMILLAKMRSKFQPTEEGAELYRKGMDILAVNRLKDVAATFKEYYERYLTGCNPETLFKIAGYYHQHKDHEWAAKCFELLSDDEATPSNIREKAMFQCARQMEFVGKIDIALHYYRQFVDKFPDSAFKPKALSRIEAF
jgi:membrane associated rhomboid family serine protease